MSAPLIRSRLWRYINLFTYLLTYLLTMGRYTNLSTFTLYFTRWRKSECLAISTRVQKHDRRRVRQRAV